MLEPYYQEDGQTIYLGDCREILPKLGTFDLLLTDPPYGINWRPRVNHIGKDHVWKDTERFDPSFCLGHSKKCVFWGAQYFCDGLPISEAWLTWVKRPISLDFSNDGRTYATIELAWTNLEIKPSFKAIVWDGGMRQGDASNRTFCHPSQKPIELMKWCIGKANLSDGSTLIDPYLGSGTTLLASKSANIQGVGIEINERYCEIAANRLRQRVFNFEPENAPEAQPQQTKMFKDLNQ